MSPAERSVASGSGPSAPSGALAASSMTAVGGPTRILLVEDEENFRDPLAFGPVSYTHLTLPTKA